MLDGTYYLGAPRPAADAAGRPLVMDVRAMEAALLAFPRSRLNQVMLIETALLTGKVAYDYQRPEQIDATFVLAGRGVVYPRDAVYGSTVQEVAVSIAAGGGVLWR